MNEETKLKSNKSLYRQPAVVKNKSIIDGKPKHERKKRGSIFNTFFARPNDKVNQRELDEKQQEYARELDEQNDSDSNKVE